VKLPEDDKMHRLTLFLPSKLYKSLIKQVIDKYDRIYGNVNDELIIAIENHVGQDNEE